MTHLSLISSSGLLSAEEEARLRALSSDAEQSFATAQVFRTDTEMRIGVLGDFQCPTPDAKYWQAVREQDVHAQELVRLSYEYRKVLIERKRLVRRLESEQDEIEREAIELDYAYQGHIATLMQREAHHRLREIANWAAIKAELRPLLKFGTQDVNAHQLEAMRIRWANEARLVNDHTPPADARNILGLASASMAGVRG